MTTYVEPQTRNITRLFRTATPTEIEAGADWYKDANRIASALALKNGVSIEIAAGVIAALSPLQSYGANINLASRFLATPGGLTSGYLGVGLAKGRAILSGADVEKTLKSQKITNFFRGILSAGKRGVCIDRHAYALASNVRGDTPNLNGKRYDQIAECYVRAARILSKEYDMPLTPAQVQAVTWTLWRRKFWSAGAFDKHDDVV